MSAVHTALTVTTAAAGVYVLVCVGVFFGQRSLLYHPMAELGATPAAISLEYEEFMAETDDGGAVHGWYVPAGGNDRNLTVLFCHGNAGNISHRLDTLRLLHGMGLAVCIFDYRGYGRSPGSPGEAKTYADAEAAWRWVRDRKRAAPGEIVCWGRSLGGAVAANLAMRQSRAGTPPAALVLESSFTSVPDMGRAIYPFLPVRLLSRLHYDTLSILGEVDCPVLVIHSLEDDIVPFSQGRALFQAAQEPKTFLEISGGHNFGFLQSEKSYTRGVEAFLRTVHAGN